MAETQIKGVNIGNGTITEVDINLVAAPTISTILTTDKIVMVNSTNSFTSAVPISSFNTAFNKNFGETAGTVLEGRTFGTAASNNTGDFLPNQFSKNINSQDFDSVIDNGLYTSYSPTNSPSGSGGSEESWTLLRNTEPFTDFGSELAIGYYGTNRDRFFFRTKLSSWGSWKELWHSGNFDPTDYAPASDSGNYIQNQDVVYQSANIKIAGSIESQSGFFVSSGDPSNSWLNLNNLSGGNNYRLISGIVGVTNNGFSIRNTTAGRDELKFNTDGAATFASSINTAGYLLNGNNLFSSLSTNAIAKWDGTKLVDSSIVGFPGFGTTGTTAAYGDHNHSGVYQPAGSYDNYGGWTINVNDVSGTNHYMASDHYLTFFNGTGMTARTYQNGSNYYGVAYDLNLGGLTTIVNPTLSNYIAMSDGTNNFKVTGTTLQALIGSGGGSGTVTSVSAGAGMNFTTITGTGSVAMGTPSTLTATSTNSASGTTHTHQITGFLPLAGGTLTGALYGTSSSFSSTVQGSQFYLNNGSAFGGIWNTGSTVEIGALSGSTTVNFKVNGSTQMTLTGSGLSVLQPVTATSFVFGTTGFSFEVVSGKLIVKYSGTSLLSLDTLGNFKVLGEGYGGGL